MCQMKLAILLTLGLSSVQCADKRRNEETWKQDLSDSFKIEGSDQGIQKVNLKCGSNSMLVTLETEKDFTGVMYTRGSFYKQSDPCFVRPKARGSRSLEMKFTLDQCQTQKEGDVFSNIVVIQNDPDLITPGDSAFSLECDFRKPRNIDVGAEIQTRDRVCTGSRISLKSPDPSANPDDEKNLLTVSSPTDTVTYVPVRHSGEGKIILGTAESIYIEVNELKDEL